ncbi:MAG: hypothetical protein AAFX94_20825 [Myxococcota bacterium]
MRTEWRKGFLFGALGAAGLLVACPGSIENPDELVGEIDCVAYTDQLIERSCSISGCHDAATNSADLNLAVDDITTTLVDVPGTDDCNGEPLISSTDPELSLMYTKLTNTPTCRDRMPLFARPPQEFEVECMLEWVQAQIPGPPAEASTDSDDLN